MEDNLQDEKTIGNFNEKKIYQKFLIFFYFKKNLQTFCAPKNRILVVRSMVFEIISWTIKG